MQPGCGLSAPCGDGGKCWIEGDYLLWWVKRNNFPPLVTTGIAPGNGAIGQRGTEVLVGGDNLDSPQRSGGHFNFGGWATEYHEFGVEGGFFIMESSSRSFSLGSTGNVLLARPFFNTVTGLEDSAIIAAPGVAIGNVAGDTEGIKCDSGRFMGADLHAIFNLCCAPNARLDFLIGYRYLTLDDRFGMTENQISPLLGVVSITDRIDTDSRFNGGQIGLRGEYYCDRWLVRASGKVSFGESDNFVKIAGVTTVPGTEDGFGFLARPSNSGEFHSSPFSVVPEVEVTLGYKVCDFVRLTLSYNFLYWSNVVRSGGQVDHAINPLEVPALNPLGGFIAPPPSMVMHCTDFWATGFSVGLELRF
jgi:hypothetical protein